MLSVAIVSVAALLAAGCSKNDDTSGGGSKAEQAPEGAAEVSVESSTVPAGVSDKLVDSMARTMRRFKVPGAVVSLRDPGVGEWSAVAGTADVEDGTPMALDLQWPVRSITKSFTVTVLLQLVDEGVLSLDDTIDQWVSGIPNGDRITLGQLAEMTSGVPDYTGEHFVEDFTADPTAAFTREQILDYVREGEPSTAPGEDRHYINSSTVLLGEVIEQVEGAGFDEVVSRRVLEPLGLVSTAYPTDVEGFTARHPTGYQPDGDELSIQPTNFTVFNTAGAMTSNVEDLMVWGRALATGELLDEQTHARRLVGSPLTEGPEYDSYAFGIGELVGWWGHTGEGFGYTTLVMHDPDSEATVVILMNVSNVDEHAPTVLFREVAAILAH